MKTARMKTVKTSVNLELSVKRRIEDLAKNQVIKSQTEFINSALRKSLDDLEKEVCIKRLRYKLQNLKGYRSKMTVLEARDHERAESIDSHKTSAYCQKSLMQKI